MVKNDTILKRNPIKSFLIGLTLSAVTVGLISFLLLLLTFNLAGGETLSQIENQNITQLIISIFLLFIAIIIARYYIKSNKKYAAIGMLVVPVVVVIAATIYLLGQNFYHADFDKIAWRQSKRKPERMAKTLVKENILIGLTRAQVKEMLSEGTEEYGDVNSERGSIVYLVQNDWTLIVLFQKDKVVETKLRLPYLGV